MIVIFLGILIGIQVVRKNVPPYNYLKKWKYNKKIKNEKLPDINWNLPGVNNDIYKTIVIPIEFLPKYSVELDEYGNQTYDLSIGTDSLILSTQNVGLVLVDTWGNKNEDPILKGRVKKQKLFLDKARLANITIVHAPNRPVVDKYHQYHKIKEVVLDSLNKYKDNLDTPTFLDIPTTKNEIYLQQLAIRKKINHQYIMRFPRVIVIFPCI